MGAVVTEGAGPGPNRTATLERFTVSVILGAMSPATITSYNRTLNHYFVFLQSLNRECQILPTNPGHLCLYASHLYRLGMAPATIRSKMCAVSFLHKLYSKPDPCDNFLFKKLMIGFSKINPQEDSRLPITLPMIRDILAKLPTLGLEAYSQLLFRTMLLVAFAGFLRPCEFSGNLHHVMRQHVNIQNGLLNMTYFTFKTSDGRPVTLQIEATGTRWCPVNAMQTYLRFRGEASGSLFTHISGRPVTTPEFSRWFSLAISSLNISGRFSAHSIRIGSATHAAAMGVPDSEIQTSGRWNSDAYHRYIRVVPVPV